MWKKIQLIIQCNAFVQRITGLWHGTFISGPLILNYVNGKCPQQNHTSGITSNRTMVSTRASPRALESFILELVVELR